MVRRGGTDPAESVGAGSGDRSPAFPDEFQSQGMAGNAHGDRGEGGGHDVRHEGAFRQDQGQGTGPEFLSEPQGLLRDTLNQIFGLSQVRHVNDEGIEKGPVLYLENAGYRE